MRISYKLHICADTFINDPPKCSLSWDFMQEYFGGFEGLNLRGKTTGINAKSKILKLKNGLLND